MLDSLELPPVHPDQFEQWLNDPITQHLFKGLKDTYLDCMLDPLPTVSMERITITAIKREAYREFVDQVFEWSPDGCEKNTNDEVEQDE